MGQPVTRIIAGDNLASNDSTVNSLANNGLDDAYLVDIDFGVEAKISITLLLVDTISAVEEVDKLDQRLCFLYRFLASKALVVMMHLLEGKLGGDLLGLYFLFCRGRKNTSH
jgi:hypothetical protein